VCIGTEVYLPAPLPPPGVNHNIPVLRDIITQPRFIAGDINTNFIKEVYPNGFKGQWEALSQTLADLATETETVF